MTSKNLYSFIDSFSLKCCKYLTLSWVSLRCQSPASSVVSSERGQSTPCRGPDCRCRRIHVGFSASLAPRDHRAWGWWARLSAATRPLPGWTGRSGEGRAARPVPPTPPGVLPLSLGRTGCRLAGSPHRPWTSINRREGQSRHFWFGRKMRFVRSN